MDMLKQLKQLKPSLSRISFSLVDKFGSAHFTTKLNEGVKRYCKPQPGWFNLNTDGGFKSCNENIGAIGALLRNHDGDVIMGFSKFILEGEGPFEMECAAIVFGLKKVIRLGLDNIAILSDAHSLVDAVNNVQRNPAMKHREEIRKIIEF